MRFACTMVVPSARPSAALGAGAASSVPASRSATRAWPADKYRAAALPRGPGRLVQDPFGAILKTAFAAGHWAPHVDRRHRHEGVGYRHHRQERYEERRHAPSSPSPPTCPGSIDAREDRGPRRGLWPHGAPRARKLLSWGLRSRNVGARFPRFERGRPPRLRASRKNAVGEGETSNAARLLPASTTRIPVYHWRGRRRSKRPETRAGRGAAGPAVPR